MGPHYMRPFDMGLFRMGPFTVGPLHMYPKVPLNHDMNWQSFGNKGRQLHLYYYEANKRNNQLNTFISLFRLAFKSYAILLRYCAFQSESTFLNFLSEEGVITIA